MRRNRISGLTSSTIIWEGKRHGHLPAMVTSHIEKSSHCTSAGAQTHLGLDAGVRAQVSCTFLSHAVHSTSCPIKVTVFSPTETSQRQEKKTFVTCGFLTPQGEPAESPVSTNRVFTGKKTTTINIKEGKCQQGQDFS